MSLPPRFDRSVYIDKMAVGEVAWFMAPKGQRKTITIENGGDFTIDWKDAAGLGVLVERVPGAGASVQLNITGNVPRGASESLPVIRLRAKSNPIVENVVKLLVLPPKKVKVNFFNVADTPPKAGQAVRSTTHNQSTTEQMRLEANNILKPQANIELQNVGLSTATLNGQLPSRITFTKKTTDDTHKNRDWREEFVKKYLEQSATDFSVFFFLDFDVEGHPGAQAFTERIESSQRWYCFQKESTGGNDGKSLAHETGHTLLGDFFAATQGHSPSKEEIMWPTLEEGGMRIHLETARAMNARAPVGD